jgi:hypothetical protein
MTEDLLNLIKCKKHPKYTGIRPPSPDCERCAIVWLGRRLDAAEAELRHARERRLSARYI